MRIIWHLEPPKNWAYFFGKKNFKGEFYLLQKFLTSTYALQTLKSTYRAAVSDSGPTQGLLDWDQKKVDFQISMAASNM